MPASLPEVQLAEAVTLVRRGRHHATCNCTLYRDDAREGFCSYQESTYTKSISRLLDDVMRARRHADLVSRG